MYVAQEDSDEKHRTVPYVVFFAVNLPLELKKQKSNKL
jgi:hypothetical protein